MPSITIKNIPTELYQRLKESAQANRRSLNSEIIACIEMATTSQVVEVEPFIQRARQLREKTARYRLTDQDFNQAKNEGRS
jgi:antitoxin FitA